MSRLSAILHESSIPGFARFGTFSTPTARSIWCAVLVLSFVGFTIHTGFLVARFAQSGTVTLTVLNAEPFVYPDVTICNGFPYNSDRTKNNVTFVSSNRSYPMSTKKLINQIKNFWKAALDIGEKKLNIYTRSDNPVSRKSLDRFAINLDMAHHLDELVIDCKFQGAPCQISDFEENIYPFYQKCWTFRPTQRSTFEPGPRNGLRLMLHVGDRRAFLSDQEILGWLRGVVTIIHDPYTLAIPKDGAVIAAAGKHTLIELEMTRSIRRNSELNPCIQFSDNKTISTIWLDKTSGLLGSTYAKKLVEHTYEYDYDSCYQLQKQREYVTECGCLSETLPVDMSMFTSMSPNEQMRSSALPPYCHELEPDLLFGPTYDQSNNGSVIIEDPSIGQWVQFTSWQKDTVTKQIGKHVCHETIHQRQKRGFTSDHYNSQCPHRCDSRNFHASVMPYNWPESVTNAKPALRAMIEKRMETATDPSTLNRTVMNNLHSLRVIRSTFLKVDIYPKLMKGTRIVESLAYPFSACFSDFGGVLGLWMGMSIITFIEIFSTCFIQPNKSEQEDEKHEQDDQNGANGANKNYVTFPNDNNEKNFSAKI